MPPRPVTAMEVLEFGVGRGVRMVQFAENMALHEASEAELDALAARARGADAALEVGMQSFDAALLR